MNSKYKERAIPLITVDQVSGKYTLTAEANDFLKSVPAPIGVVSVAGLYRTGKSYLLNQMLLNRSNGFGVGPTINPCTKGLWCWGTPIKGQAADGQKLNIIVVDTEGIGALDVDQTHDTRIFTLAILASSCFIYNSVGSIDQTAVQNLSLVVNLTKSIQLKTQKSIDDEDPDKISNYFPSFFWVVRDFSLQILDTQGNKMTSKQYLERALAPQKGTSDDIQQKNRIRKMLTSFFKQRECFTLVRPLIDEQKLQSLDKMSFDDLRPEFVSQVINFRKRVTGRIKPKTLNGQKLSGELYLSMLSSYVGAINDGAVPNIQNAWNYMCQQQCTKVMVESLQIFESQLKEIRIPCSAEQMNKNIEAAQQAALEKFKKKSIGQQSEKYMKQLQSKMRERAKQLKKVNAQQGKSAFKKYITPFVTTIQQKITKQQFGSFEDFLEQLKKLQQKITKQGPNYVDSNLNCQICINKILGQGVTYLFKRMKNQKQQIKKTLEERIKLNENEIDNLKKQRDSEQSSMRQKLSQLDKEKVDVYFRLQKLQMELERTTRQRNNEGQQLSKNLTAKKAQIEQIKKQFQTKVTQANSKIQQMSKSIHEERGIWEKDKAMYDLKVKQQSERIEECQKKLQNFTAKSALETNELIQKYRQQGTKMQEQLIELTRTLAQSKERNEQLTIKNDSLTKQYSSLSERFEATERKLRQQTSQKSRQMQKLRNQHESQLNKVKNEFMQTRDDSEKVGKQMEDKVRKQQLKSKELSQQLKTVKSRYQKQNQVLAQQLQFSKRSLQQFKQKLIEQKSIFENKLAAAEADSGLQRQQQVKRKISELKATHEQQIYNLENESKQTQRTLNIQIENLTRIRNELELKLKVTAEQLNTEKAEHQQTKQTLKRKYEGLQNELKTASREKTSQLLAKEGYFNEKIASLQRQLEETRQNYYAQKSEMDNKASNQITQIKNYYEMEREKQESRHSEEKDKQKKKYSKMVQEYERKLQEENENHQEEVQRIQGELGNEINALTATCNGLTHQKDSLSRDRSVLQQKLQALNQLHTKMQFELNDKLQKLIESSRTEKQFLTKRLEQLQQNKNEMEKELLSLTHERDLYRNQSQRLSSQKEQYKLQYNSLSQKYQSTKRSLEDRLKEIQGNYMRDKSKFQTDIALLQQKKDFAEQKIVQLESDLKTTKQRQQEQMKTLRQKYQQQIANLTVKLTNDKKSYEQKLEKTKKLSLETQANLNKLLSEVNKQKAICQQKIQYLEKKLNQSQLKRTSQIQSLAEQLKATKERLSLENSRLKVKAEELQQILNRKEGQFSQQRSQYQLKLALADNSIKNLQQWSDNTINEKGQMIRNLERQLDDSRKRNQNQKSSQQLTHQQIISRMQSKYRSEITFLNQQVIKKTQQYEYVIKQHEKEKKQLNEKLAVEKQNRIGLEAKITRVESEYIQKQNKLISENERLKMEKEAINTETHKIIDRERQSYRSKIVEIEKKAGEADRLRQQAVYDKEKEQAKWKMEKNAWESKIDELRQAAEKQKNDNMKLVKQNEKLKAQKKKNTSFIKNNQTTIMTRQISTENKQNSQYQ